MSARGALRLAAMVSIVAGCGGRLSPATETAVQPERIGDVLGAYAAMSQDAERVWWSWSDESGRPNSSGIAYIANGSSSANVLSRSFGGYAVATDVFDVWTVDIRADSDGELYATSIESGMTRLVRRGLVYSVAVDERSVFFSDSQRSGSGFVTRMPKAGGPEQRLVPGYGIGRIVVDDTYVYYRELCYSDESCGQRVRRFRKDLSTFDATAPTTLAEFGVDTWGDWLVLSGTELFWGEGTSIVAYDRLTGAKRVLTEASGSSLGGLAVDARYAYFLAGPPNGGDAIAGSSLQRVPRAGGAVEMVLRDLGAAYNLVVDDSSIYFLVSQPYLGAPLTSGVYRVRKPVAP